MGNPGAHAGAEFYDIGKLCIHTESMCGNNVACEYGFSSRPQSNKFQIHNCSCVMQVYFPAFIGSSIYLRFLNELVQMLNKDDESAQSSSTTECTKTSAGAAVLKMSPIALGKDLDDPDSLWERPALLYVHAEFKWLHNAQCG